MELEKAVNGIIAMILIVVVVGFISNYLSNWFCRTKLTTINRDEQGRITEVMERCI